MLRLIRLGLLTILLLTVGIGAATAAGRQRSSPLLLAALHLTDCAPPCWIGIVPGETTLQAARDQVIRELYRAGFLVQFDFISAPGLLWVNLQRPRDPLGMI